MEIPLLLTNQVGGGSLKQSHLILVIKLKFWKYFISKFAYTLLVNGLLFFFLLLMKQMKMIVR